MDAKQDAQKMLGALLPPDAEQDEAILEQLCADAAFLVDGMYVSICMDVLLLCALFVCVCIYVFVCMYVTFALMPSFLLTVCMDLCVCM